MSGTILAAEAEGSKVSGSGRLAKHVPYLNVTSLDPKTGDIVCCIATFNDDVGHVLGADIDSQCLLARRIGGCLRQRNR